MRRASAVARWSIQTMMLRAASPEVLTDSGRPWRSNTTSEQVASNPMPLTADGGRPACCIATRIAWAQALQMSSDDCSTTSPAACQIMICCRAVASKVPLRSKTPARALAVPTSTPMKACMALRVLWLSKLPAGIAAVSKNNAAGHEAGGVGSKEQHDRGDFLHLTQALHRGA